MGLLFAQVKVDDVGHDYTIAPPPIIDIVDIVCIVTYTPRLLEPDMLACVKCLHFYLFFLSLSFIILIIYINR